MDAKVQKFLMSSLFIAGAASGIGVGSLEINVCFLAVKHLFLTFLFNNTGINYSSTMCLGVFARLHSKQSKPIKNKHLSFIIETAR